MLKMCPISEKMHILSYELRFISQFKFGNNCKQVKHRHLFLALFRGLQGVKLKTGVKRIKACPFPENIDISS